jgi:hypothetical protein
MPDYLERLMATAMTVIRKETENGNTPESIILSLNVLTGDILRLQSKIGKMQDHLSRVEYGDVRSYLDAKFETARLRDKERSDRYHSRTPTDKVIDAIRRV